MKINIFQIFYDVNSKKQLNRQFIPLDNSSNQRPDWFEFWPILIFLRQNTLEEHTLYGFFSPKFTNKTSLSMEYIQYLVSKSDHDTDVFLFSHSWDQICYFINPWEQAEVWHPGIKNLTQNFLNYCGINFDVENTIADTNTTVFSNYFIANKSFWLEWQSLAEKYYLFIESGFGKSTDISTYTSYGSNGNNYPIKTFIQERFVNILLLSEKYKTQYADFSHLEPINSILFPCNSNTRLLLQSCDIMKKMYRTTKENIFLENYWNLRTRIKYKNPMM